MTPVPPYAPGTVCDRCGVVHEALTTQGRRRCQRHRQSGVQCGKVALSGTDACTNHSGLPLAAAKAKGQANLARQEAIAAVERYGLPRDIAPHEALLDEIARTAGHVEWLRSRINDIDPDLLVTGIASVRRVTTTATPDVETTSVTAAQINLWWQLYQSERAHLVRVCDVAMKARVDERRVQLAEQHGVLLAAVIQGVLTDLGVADHPDVNSVVRRQLAIAQEAIT